MNVTEAGAAAQPNKALERARQRTAGMVWKRLVTGTLAFSLGLGGAVVGGVLDLLLPSSPGHSPLALYIMLPAAGPCMALALWIPTHRRDQRAIRLIANEGNNTDAGRLLEARPVTEWRAQGLVDGTTRAWIATMSPDTASSLTAEQRYQLNELLLAGTVDEAVGLLAALDTMGDASALPYVEGLARGFTFLPRAWWPRTPVIRQAARKTAAAIRARIQGSASQRVLLRASRPGDTSPEDLIRPVRVTEVDAYTLIRTTATSHDAPAAPVAVAGATRWRLARARRRRNRLGH